MALFCRGLTILVLASSVGVLAAGLRILWEK
jgi:hypothetical protein